MNTFTPDLIIEVTSVCNRACAGCYAPNVVSKDGAKNLFESRPELFLSASALQNSLSAMGNFSNITAIRGGEPSVHPKLPQLLAVASTYSKQVMIETHGRWLLPQNIKEHQELIKSIRENKAVVKISFDKMHGLKKEELQKITDFLNWNEIEYKIAITEASLTEYFASRSLCDWISEDKIIYQLKAKSESELVKPLFGTINVRGELKPTLSHIFSSESAFGVAIA